jgi:hypothetical protein
LVAITVFAVGMSAMAALVAQMSDGTDRAKQLSTATTLVSEKLEDLSRWPASDPHVAAGGSLTADSASGVINYYDDVTISNLSGNVTESIASTTGGSTTYTNVVHNATGYVDTGATNVSITAATANVFHRRWLIEAGPIVNGITLTGSRRVTVLVTMTDRPGHAISFQLSQVRP